MKINNIVLLSAIVMFLSLKTSAGNLEKDTILASGGPLFITFIGHGTIMFEYNGKVVHVDPTSQMADYSQLPAGDIILITHEHGDHFDKTAIQKILKNDTRIFLTKKCSENTGDLKNVNIISNGDVTNVGNIKIEAVPAYNIANKRPDENPFHPKGEGNGYVLTFGNKKVYIAGDTENIPEMSNLKNIDVAFLPMNLPYTMTPEMVTSAALSFMPKILYPYHYGNTDTGKLVELLKNHEEIEVRIRNMK